MRRHRYLGRLEHTLGMLQVVRRIEEFRATVTPRAPRVFPH
ncbi:hypothetical protein KZZ52_12185 [Dactylosporangium sp. AC04546]|nr:hypothetical protein [Dactylosporangium sp. AC04546]WVK86098.1 hypothetical protein KZZ52_12185 [Dactylosporangium sp. AC04546]